MAFVMLFLIQIVGRKGINVIGLIQDNHEGLHIGYLFG
jgi:hypothetical protein